MSQDLYVRNYLTHENFKLIKEKFDCDYLARQDVRIFEENILKKKNCDG